MGKFDEYKMLAERAEKYSERRQTTSQTYLTINTAIFGAAAFLVKDSGLTGWYLVLAISPLFIVGGLICIIWLNIILGMEKLLNWQYKQLRELEKQIPDDINIFTKENNEFFNQGKGKKKFSFSLLEAWLPRILMIVYVVYFIGMLFGACNGLI